MNRSETTKIFRTLPKLAFKLSKNSQTKKYEFYFYLDHLEQKDDMRMWKTIKAASPSEAITLYAKYHVVAYDPLPFIRVFDEKDLSGPFVRLYIDWPKWQADSNKVHYTRSPKEMPASLKAEIEEDLARIGTYRPNLANAIGYVKKNKP
jgi:hypothetical protein